MIVDKVRRQVISGFNASAHPEINAKIPTHNFMGEFINNANSLDDRNVPKRIQEGNVNR